MGMKPRVQVMTTHTVICQGWEETEAGWGTRPDGFSLHLTLEDCKTYAQGFWKHQKEHFDKQGVVDVPAEYDRQAGSPFKTIVNQQVYDKIAAGDHGIRCWACVVDGKVAGKGVPWPASSGWKSNDPPRLDKAEADVQ